MPPCVKDIMYVCRRRLVDCEYYCTKIYHKTDVHFFFFRGTSPFVRDRGEPAEIGFFFNMTADSF